MFAICGGLLHERQVLMALRMIISFYAYLRPCEATALRVKHVVAPNPGMAPQIFGLLLHDQDEGVPGKTGLYDDAVMLDNTLFLNDCLQLMLLTRHPEEMLFPFRVEDLRDKLNELSDRMGLAPLQPNLYALRHGGASEDLRNRQRPALDVQLRGRWKTSNSLRRYAKTTRLTTQLNKIDRRVVEYGTVIKENIVTFITQAANRGVPAVPAPPMIAARRRRADMWPNLQ